MSPVVLDELFPLWIFTYTSVKCNVDSCDERPWAQYSLTVTFLCVDRLLRVTS